jgi:hypothetical protein
MYILYVHIRKTTLAPPVTGWQLLWPIRHRLVDNAAYQRQARRYCNIYQRYDGRYGILQETVSYSGTGYNK